MPQSRAVSVFFNASINIGIRDADVDSIDEEGSEEGEAVEHVKITNSLVLYLCRKMTRERSNIMPLKPDGRTADEKRARRLVRRRRIFHTHGGVLILGGLA
jgi:hypothetical protein